MEDWQLDFEWLRVQHMIKKRFKRSQLPDLNSVLFLIGIQELGRLPGSFSKEEKQDLMHIATCTLLCYDDYYEFKGRDADGWPHFDVLKPIDITGVKEQEKLLKKNVIRYFEPWSIEDEEE